MPRTLPKPAAKDRPKPKPQVLAPEAIRGWVDKNGKLRPWMDKENPALWTGAAMEED